MRQSIIGSSSEDYSWVDEILEQDTTLTKNQWFEQMLYAEGAIAGSRVVAQAGIYLQDHIVAWMGAPIAIYKGESISCENISVPCLKEFKKELENTDRKFIMYQPILILPIPQFSKTEDGACVYEGMTKESWTIRGCFL